MITGARRNGKSWLNLQLIKLACMRSGVTALIVRANQPNLIVSPDGSVREAPTWLNQPASIVIDEIGEA